MTTRGKAEAQWGRRELMVCGGSPDLSFTGGWRLVLLCVFSKEALKQKSHSLEDSTRDLSVVIFM